MKLQKFNNMKIFYANYFQCENFPIYGNGNFSVYFFIMNT